MIALALACKPKILLADEPTRARCLPCKSRILLLLRELQREFGMSVIFVTHDIGVGDRNLRPCRRDVRGQIVEQGTLSQIVRSPMHPYARGLLAIHRPRAKRGQRLETIPGRRPRLDRAPGNCSFAPRCAFAEARCIEAAAAQRAGGTGPNRKVHPGGNAPKPLPPVAGSNASAGRSRWPSVRSGRRVSARMHLAIRSGPTCTLGGSCSIQRASAKAQAGRKRAIAWRPVERGRRPADRLQPLASLGAVDGGGSNPRA